MSEVQTEFQTLAELERLHVLKALDLAGGSKTRAAELLGVSIKTVYNKLAGYTSVEASPDGAADQQ